LPRRFKGKIIPINSASIKVVGQREELIIALAEDLESEAGIVTASGHGDSDDPTEVIRTTIIFGDYGGVFGSADVVRAVEIVKGRDGKYHALPGSVQPGKRRERVTLIDHIATYRVLLRWPVAR